jgi:hypothetical protein
MASADTATRGNGGDVDRFGHQAGVFLGLENARFTSGERLVDFTPGLTDNLSRFRFLVCGNITQGRVNDRNRRTIADKLGANQFEFFAGRRAIDSGECFGDNVG